jgi:phage tail sheath protein FI
MQAMEGVSTSTAGFVGMAERGPVVGTPVFLTSFTDYKRTFGGYLSETSHGNNRFLPYAVEQFFANGGARCFVMRVAPPDAKTASVVLNAVQISAANPGKWANEVKVAVSAASSFKTAVLAFEETLAGDIIYTMKNASGLRVGDIVAVSEKGELGEYNRVASVNGDKVTFEAAFEKDITDKGLVPKRVLVTAEVNITVSYGDNVENFEFVSFNAASPAYITNRLSKSSLVKVNYKPVDGIFPPMLAFTGDPAGANASVYLSGGADGNCAGADEGVFIGAGAAPGKRTGLEAFVEISNVSIMAIPGITAPAVQLALVAQCQNLANRFAVLDMPGNMTKPQDLLTHREIVDSDYAAMYHPWLTVYDAQARKAANIPPSGSICGIYARNDNTRGVHKAPANEVVNNCIGLSSLYNKGEQDLLNPAGVNLIRALPGQGIRVWGGRTCSSNGLWKYVNVRRLFIYLEETIRTQTNWAVFEPNDSVLWMRVKLTITSFLRDMYRSGALVGATEGEAFFVNCGYETMTQQDILNGRMICEIGVAPSRPAEFIIFRITQHTGSGDQQAAE